VLALNKPINSETNVREVVWSAAGRSAHNCQTPRKTGTWEIWAHNESPILDRLLAILTNGAAFMGRRYVFVTVQFSANKCAIELYEKPEKGEKWHVFPFSGSPTICFLRI
jgi:hypothetical protein